MKDYFYALTDDIASYLKNGHQYTAWFDSEKSDFVRFNKGRVRQPGAVSQHYLTLRIIDGLRQTSKTIGLSGVGTQDRELLMKEMAAMQSLLPALPEDPHLLLNRVAQSTDNVAESKLAPSGDIVESILARAGAHDFVGIYAGGEIFRGFANSFGQRNWFANSCYNLDFSLYHAGDKAVKSSLAGFEWDGEAFDKKIDHAAEQLALLQKEPKTIDPGQYRVYLAPAAVDELLQLLSWGGFGLSSHRTKQTPLLKMLLGDETLHRDISLTENTTAGASPCFQEQGFIRPDSVRLIEEGNINSTLNSPRSAKEYGAETNGANGGETPESLEMRAGNLADDEVTRALGTGLIINNLWYLNYSDCPGGRVTGMTRFATLWVEDGVVQSPVNVMRFDDSIYEMLGRKLEAIGKEQDFMMSTSTYGQRSTSSSRVPGVLIDGLSLTL